MIVQQLKRFKNTCIWSWQGWCDTWRNEISLRQWTVLFVLSCGLAFYLDLARGERALIVALGLLVLASELMNTAIERVVDLVTTDKHPLAGKAKDAGSAFVAVTALAAGAAWLVILYG